MTTQSLHRPESDSFFEASERLLPLGIGSVGRLRKQRVVLDSASGGRIIDIDGNEFVDTVMGLGPIVVGHGEESVNRAVISAIERTVILGAESPLMLDVAAKAVERIPSAEHVVFSNSGSEADQAALRIARATTGKTKVLKFEGHFHGWLDPMYVNMSGVAPSTEPGPELTIIPHCEGQIDANDFVIVGRWNDIDAFDRLIERHADDLAAVIMEPIPFNFGSYRARDGYLEHVRRVCTERSIILIFDEVVSGFRVGPGGAQKLLGVTPDMSVFAKALGGGYPVSMVVGSSWAMSSAISGAVKHSGTYNANPVSMAAAKATLELMDSIPDLYDRLSRNGEYIAASIRAIADTKGAPLQVNCVGSGMQLFWDAKGDRNSYQSCATSDRGMIARLGERMLHHGVHMTPRGLIFTCYRHTERDLERIVIGIAAALDDLL